MGAMNVVVVGWPGAGKTTVSGMLARVFSAREGEVLAIADDNPPALARTLGVGGETDVPPLPADLLQRVHDPAGDSELELAKPPEAIIDDYGVTTPAGVTLLTLAEIDHGGSGCECSGHDTVRRVLARLLHERDEVIVIDAVASIGHLARDTLGEVDIVLVVVDPHFKSLEAGRRLRTFAVDRGVSDVRLLANDVRTADQRTAIEAFCAATDQALGGVVPFDETLHDATSDAPLPIDADAEAGAVSAIRTVAAELSAAHDPDHEADQRSPQPTPGDRR